MKHLQGTCPFFIYPLLKEEMDRNHARFKKKDFAFPRLMHFTR